MPLSSMVMASAEHQVAGLLPVPRRDSRPAATKRDVRTGFDHRGPQQHSPRPRCRRPRRRRSRIRVDAVAPDRCRAGRRRPNMTALRSVQPRYECAAASGHGRRAGHREASTSTIRARTPASRDLCTEKPTRRRQRVLGKQFCTPDDSQLSAAASTNRWVFLGADVDGLVDQQYQDPVVDPVGLVQAGLYSRLSTSSSGPRSAEPPRMLSSFVEHGGRWPRASWG